MKGKHDFVPFLGKKKSLLSSVYTGADPKLLKSTQIFAWTSEDPESDL